MGEHFQEADQRYAIQTELPGLTKLRKQNSESRSPGQLEIVGQNTTEEGATEREFWRCTEGSP